VSLLPKYRGAAPMQRAVMAGETKTGVTAILMDEGMDTGDILCSETFSIGENDTFGDVFERSAASGGPLLAKALSALFNKTAVPQKQNHSEATYAQKIAKEETALSFDISASHLHNIIRGLSPVPLGYVKTPDGKLLKIVSSRVSGHNGEGIPGTVLALDPKGEGAVTVACAAGAIDLIRVKPEGKGEMSAADLIRGRKIKIGDVLTQ
ncbi:MAG: methionyl-tRNA formyltransferase, partial [Clostridia bacterium]|nr:methionyl-tRNA formyltransferase [Clostridia bacterium]